MDIPEKNVWVPYEDFIGKEFKKGTRIRVVAGSTGEPFTYNGWIVYPKDLLFLKSSNGTVIKFDCFVANDMIYTGYISGPFILKELKPD